MGKQRRLWRTFRRNKTAVIGSVIALIVIIIAISAPWISPYDPLEHNVFYRLTEPEWSHFLGTDSFGRDVFSRVLHGARVSLMVGIFSVLLGALAGTVMGILAGFKGGMIENVIMRGVDVLMSFPTLIMGLMVMAILGSGLVKLIFAIGVVMTPRFARVAHGPTLSIKEKDFVDAARSLGVSDFRIFLRHILPNIFGEILVMGTLWTATAIRIEANLSFIGLGVSPPTPTWGNMIRNGVDHLTNAPWLSVFPGLAILITVLSFNMMGDGIRDVTDPKLQE